MPAQTEKQKKFFGAVEGAKHGEKGVSGKAKKVAKEISDDDAKKFLKTKDEDEEGVPLRKLHKNHSDSPGTVPLKKPKNLIVIPNPHKNHSDSPGTVPLKRDKKPLTRIQQMDADLRRRKEEDEESVSKQLKKKGKAVIDGPKVKDRKKSAPATQVHKDKKKYDRKKKDDTVQENMDIVNFINCLLTKKYASANKYLNNAVELKIQKHIEAELETPLFQ